MSKIANKIAYKIKSPLSLNDFMVGTNNENNVPGFAKGQTISVGVKELRDVFLGGLSPETGGQMKITEIEIATLDTDVATTVNAIDPPYEIERYEMVFFNIDGQIFLCQKTNQTIGDGETALTNNDFVEFPVSVGPQGPQGPQGPAGANGTNGTNGTNGANGTNGSTWRNGSGVPSNSLGVDGDYYLNATNGDVYLKASGTYSVVANIKGADGDSIQIEESATTSVNGDGSIGTPYQIEVKNLQKVITANVTLANTDNLHTIFVNNSGPLTITVPSTLVDNFCIAVVQLGTADVTFAQGSGATISSAVGNKIKGQYYSVILEKIEDSAVYILSNATKA